MTQGSPVVDIRNVSFRYDSQSNDRQKALDSVSLRIGRSELIGLIGQNGSGKSTLARHLNGLLKPETGSVLIAGNDTQDVETGRVAGTVGYVFQNPDHALFLTSVRDEVAYGLRERSKNGGLVDQRVTESLEMFGLTPYADEHPASLGRGMRRLVVIAAVFAMMPDLIVLDEPTGGLDYRLTSMLKGILTRYVSAGRSIVLISHDMHLIAETCSRVLVLHQGALVFDGSSMKFFQDAPLLDSVELRKPPIGELSARLQGSGIDPATITIQRFTEQFKRSIETRAIGR